MVEVDVGPPSPSRTVSLFVTNDEAAVAEAPGPSRMPSLGCDSNATFTPEEFPPNQLLWQQQKGQLADESDSATPDSASCSMAVFLSQVPSLTLTDEMFVDDPDEVENLDVPMCFAKICRYETGGIEEEMEMDEHPVISKFPSPTSSSSANPPIELWGNPNVGLVGPVEITQALQPPPIIPLEPVVDAQSELPAVVAVPEATVVYVQQPRGPLVVVPLTTVRPDICRPQPITQQTVEDAGGVAMRDSYTTSGHHDFRCKLCPVKVKDRRRIEAHFLEHHVIGVRNPLECSRCLVSSHCVDNFNKHIQTSLWCMPRERILDRGPVLKAEAADLFPGFLEVLAKTASLGGGELRCLNPKSPSSQSVCGHVVNDSDKMWTHCIRDHLGLDCWLCQNCQTLFDTHRLLNHHYKRGCIMLNAGEVEDFVPANSRMAVLRTWYAPAIEQYTALLANGVYIYSCRVEGCDFSHEAHQYMVGHLLNEHLRASRDYPTCRGLECPLCSRLFSSTTSYFLHRNRKTPCSRVFNMEAYLAEPAFAELRTHVAVGDTEKWSDGSSKMMFRCNFADCLASYPKMSTCILHIAAMHRHDFPFVCPKAVDGCRLGPYTEIRGMQVHFRLKHDASKHAGIAVWRDDNVLVNIPQDGTTCGVCSMSFATDELRWRHQLFCHTTMTPSAASKCALPCTKAYYDACTSYKLKLLKHLAENILPAIHGNPFQLLNTNNMLIWSQATEQGERPNKAELQILLNMRTVVGFVLECDERIPLGEELPEVRTELFGMAVNGALSEDTVRSLTAVVEAARARDISEDGKLDVSRFPQGSNEYFVTADNAQIWACHGPRDLFVAATGADRIIFLQGEQKDRTKATQVCYSDFIALFLSNRVHGDLDPFVQGGGEVTKSLLMTTIRKHLPAMVDLIPLAWVQQGYATLAYQPITPAVMVAAMGQEAYDAVDLTGFHTER